jgi:hypothetical protein
MAWLALFPSYNRRVAEGGGTGTAAAQSPLSLMHQSRHMQTASDSRHMQTVPPSEPSVDATLASSQPRHVSSEALSDSAAEATLDPTDLSCDLFAEFIAYLVEQDQEIRVKKVAIMAQVHGLDRQLASTNICRTTTSLKHWCLYNGSSGRVRSRHTPVCLSACLLVWVFVCVGGWPLDRSKAMSYDEFERFAYACIPYDLQVAGAHASLPSRSLLSTL